MPDSNLGDFSNKIQDIITDIPNWLVRWGNGLFLLIIGFFLAIAAFVKTPTILKGSVVLESDVLNETIISNTKGRLSNIAIPENEIVDSGGVLGFIENKINPKLVLEIRRELDTLIDSLSNSNIKSITFRKFGQIADFGELENQFEDFSKHLAELGAVESDPQSDNEKFKYVTCPILNLRSLKLNLTYDTKLALLNNLKSFQKDLARWDEEHVLRSHFRGKVIPTGLLEEGQLVKENRALFIIEPLKQGAYTAIVKLEQFSIGKVKKGQTVILNFDAYPHMEFGSLIGELDYLYKEDISGSSYSAKIRLPNGNRTTYGKRIKLKNGLLGEAQVITERRSLLSKLFNNIYYLFN